MYPGTPAPKIVSPFSVEKDGFVEREITFPSHTGTHIDAPAHMIADGKTLDDFPVSQFTGIGSVIDVSNEAQKHFSQEQTPLLIDISKLEPHRPRIEASDFVLLHTGWSQFWGLDQYYHGFPLLTPESASWLTQFSLKGFGLDAISVDPVDSREAPIHHILLGQSLILIENLTNLNQLPQTNFTFHCFPLKIQQADGSPVRTVAVV